MFHETTIAASPWNWAGISERLDSKIWGSAVRALEGLDELDCKLLELLQADDRRVLAELAKETGSSPSTINDRIKRLVRNGVITGFHARVAAETIGLGLLAFLLVSLSPKAEQRFLKKVEASQNVLECHRIAGEWNYLVKLRVKNVRDLETYLAAMTNLIGVQRINTLIALSSIKDGWAITPE